jgi:WD40 repeat protein
VVTSRLWYSLPFLLLSPALAGLTAEKDLFGDPLPEGAKARCGTARLRTPTVYPTLLSPDGKTLFAASYSGVARLDPATGAQQGKVNPLFGIPVAVSANSRRAVIVGTSQERVTVWDTTTDKVLVKIERRLPPNEAAVALSAEGAVLAIGGTGDRFKKEPATVLVWDVSTDKELKKITVPQSEYANVALSNDGKTLATWGLHFNTADKAPDPDADPARFVTFWDVASGKELAKFRVSGNMPAGVVFAPSGALAAVADGNSSIDLVDVKTGTSKHLLLGRIYMGQSMSFSPDGSTLFATSSDGTAQRWKVADGTRLSMTEWPGGAVGRPRVRAITADKGIVWARRGAAVVVWEVPSGRVLSTEGGHTDAVRGLGVTADGKHVLTSSDDGTILKWELTTGKPVGPVVLRQPAASINHSLMGAQLSPDLTRALTGTLSYLAIHDLATGTQQFVLPTPYRGSHYGTFSHDGSKVVTSSSSFDGRTPGRVTVWDVVTAKKVTTIELPGCQSVRATLTPDGKHIVTAAHKPGAVAAEQFVVTGWEVATGAKKGEFVEEHGFKFPSVTASPDNKTAAVVTAKGRLVAFEIATGKLVQIFNLDRREPFTTPVFSRDGKKLVVAGLAESNAARTAPVMLVDWELGTVRHTFTAPGGTPSAMMFSPDGKWLITGSPDTTATVWDVSKW